MKKKITLTALVNALKNDIFLKDAKIIKREGTNLVVAYKSYCIIDFSIIGENNQFVSFSVEGHITYLLCDHLLGIMEELESR